MTDADNADDLALLANTPTQAEFLLHSLEQAARGINLYVNADKAEFMCFKQEGVVSTSRSKSLKLEDLGSHISSTEKDINIRIVKVSIDIVRLEIIWKSDHW